jgi:hypothetical protein
MSPQRSREGLERVYALPRLLVSEPVVRLVLINTVLGDVATRGDFERLRRARVLQGRDLRADL